MVSARSVGGLLALGVLTLAAVALFTGGANAGRLSVSADGQRVAAPVQAAAVTDPAELLFLQTCASCHGTHGVGTDLAPSLAGTGPAAWDFYLRTGRMPLSAPGQPSYLQGRRLSEQEILQLVAYGTTIGGDTPAIPNVVVDASALNSGRELFINNCAACHGATGTGGSIGAGAFAPSIAGHDPTTLAEAMLVGPGPMPRFDWTEQQLSEVATYVQYLGHAPSPGGAPLGGYGPVPEGLIACVIGLAALVGVSRLVANGGKRGDTAGGPGGEPEPGAGE